MLRVLKSPPFAQCQYLRTVEEGAFDVVIVDSSDPVGPAAALFEAPFFALVHRALRPGGILCMQGECVWLHLDLIGASMHAMHDVGFAEVDYAWCSVPTYPSGQIGFVVCRKAGHVPPTGARPTSAEQAFGAGIVSVSRPSRPIGDDVADAFNRLFYFERAAETYVKALWTGQPLRVLSDEVAEKTACELDNYPGQAERHFAELKAILNIEEPDYNT